MPGPVSDSYDPEFSTGENARMVRELVEVARDQISAWIGSEELMDIVGVAEGGLIRMVEIGPTIPEKSLRAMRFGLNRALESL